jgi:hypothetical protein
MTSPGQLGQASEDSNQPRQEIHESPPHTGRRPADRFSLPRNKRTWLRITLFLIALAGVAVVVRGGIHLATSGGTSAATGGAPVASGSLKTSQANQAPNSSSQAKNKVPSAAQAAESGGALSLPVNMQSRVIVWQSGPGGADLAAVTRLFGDVLQAGADRQYVQMRLACVQLAHRVSTAEAGPQIPVAAMQTLYGKALAELAKGAADCQAAITITPGDEELVTTVNDTMRQQAASELAAGSKDIFRSTAEIEIASRQSH